MTPARLGGLLITFGVLVLSLPVSATPPITLTCKGGQGSDEVTVLQVQVDYDHSAVTIFVGARGFVYTSGTTVPATITAAVITFRELHENGGTCPATDYTLNRITSSVTYMCNGQPNNLGPRNMDLGPFPCTVEHKERF